MTCPEHDLTVALFDGELDAPEAARAQAHVAGCGACRQNLAEMSELRAALRDQTYYGAPASLRIAIEHAIAEAAHAPRDSWLQRWRQGLTSSVYWAGAVSGAAAAALAFMLWSSGAATDQLADMVASAHLRAQLPGHLTDIATSSPTVAERWLAAHAALSPTVVRGADGVRLVGARADYIYDRPAAVVVYRLANATIDLFAWRDDGRALPQTAEEDGLNIRFWRSGGLIYCAVSRLSAGAVARFAATMRADRE